MRAFYLIAILILSATARAIDPPADPARVDAAEFMKHGIAREKAGDVDGAIAAFDEAIRLRPRDAEAYLRRGLTWRRKGDLDRALSDLNTSIKINPTGQRAFNARGIIWTDKKDLARATADFDEAIRLAPKDPTGYLNRGMARQGFGQPSPADEDLTYYIGQRPNDPEGYFQRGKARLFNDDPQRAITDLDEAIRLKAESADAYGLRGAARLKLKQYDPALADFNEAIRLSPKLIAAHMGRGEAYGNKRDDAKAIEAYTTVLEIDPRNHSAYNLRAWIQATTPNPSLRSGLRASDDARAACELTNWKNPDYLDTLAAAEALRGRFDVAINYVTMALDNEAYAKSPAGEASRARLKLYQEKKVYVEGGPPLSRDTRVSWWVEAGPYLAAAGVGLVVVLMVAFRLYRLGVLPFKRAARPAARFEVVEDPPTAPPSPDPEPGPPTREG